MIGLSHPRSLQKLDWWDGKGTPGNRLLIDIMEQTRQQIENNLKINTNKLHYYVEKGGVFLKDAAVLAGLGCLGKNNMLVTREYGPRVRLRALFLDAEIEPTGPVRFDPCADCKVNCRRVCPEKAMIEKDAAVESIEDSLDLPARDGFYDRELCNIRMEKDVFDSKKNAGAHALINYPAASSGVLSGKDLSAASGGVLTPCFAIKYCRKCEFVCPVGK